MALCRSESVAARFVLGTFSDKGILSATSDHDMSRKSLKRNAPTLTQTVEGSIPPLPTRTSNGDSRDYNEVATDLVSGPPPAVNPTQTAHGSRIQMERFAVLVIVALVLIWRVLPIARLVRVRCGPIASRVVALVPAPSA
jgi:hypothetical protein